MLLTMHAAGTDAQQRSSGGAAAPQNKEKAESGNSLSDVLPDENFSQPCRKPGDEPPPTGAMKMPGAGDLRQSLSDVLAPCELPWRKELTPTPHVPPLQEEEERGSGAGWVAFGDADSD